MTGPGSGSAGGVLGTGIDLVSHDRIRESLDRWGARFKDRIFLLREQAYCDAKAQNWRHYAGRFAVKEAVSKAFGTGIGEHIGWLDIEVCRDEPGAPRVELSASAWELARSKGASRVLVSLSHGKDHSVAQALLIK